MLSKLIYWGYSFLVRIINIIRFLIKLISASFKVA